MTNQQSGDLPRPQGIPPNEPHTALPHPAKLNGVLRGGTTACGAGNHSPQPTGDGTHLGNGIARLLYEPEGKGVGGRWFPVGRIIMALGGAFVVGSGVFRDDILSSVIVCAPSSAPVSIIPNPQTLLRGRALPHEGNSVTLYKRIRHSAPTGSPFDARQDPVQDISPISPPISRTCIASFWTLHFA